MDDLWNPHMYDIGTDYDHRSGPIFSPHFWGMVTISDERTSPRASDPSKPEFASGKRLQFAIENHHVE